MATKAQYEHYLEEHRDHHLTELIGFLRIPSISALPDHQPDIRRAAEWVANQLRTVGMPSVAIMETDGYPVVYGDWIVDNNKPTALIYGHYDVQPVDPLDRWETPPFEPDIRNDRIYARGASDDKGNLMMPMKAVEALAHTQGAPPINLKFLFEGEEEVGSPSLPQIVRQNKRLLLADFVICADGGQWGPDTPSLELGTKGIVGCQINIRTASTDLHSGSFGATVPNAVRAAAQLAASFHDADCRVAIEGFYDDVLELTDQERQDFARIPFDEKSYLEDIGVSEFLGEVGYSPVERNWARPTLDLNGIWGGFQGSGSKTVTPSEAHIKITCRLVPNQIPGKIIKLIENHIQTHRPIAAEVTIDRTTIESANPFTVRRDHPAIVAAEEVLSTLYGRAPYFVRGGGTLPAAEIFQRELGADTVFYSWGMPDSRGHAPNENFQLKSFMIAPRAYCMYLNRIAELGKGAFMS